MTTPQYVGRRRPSRRQPRAALPPSADFMALAQALQFAAQRTFTWRACTKRALRSRFAQTALWPAQCALHGGPLPASAVELLFEWPRDGAAQITYWLAELPCETLGLRRAMRLAKGRWGIAQETGN